jgi:hypothetical protein
MRASYHALVQMYAAMMALVLLAVALWGTVSFPWLP